MTPQELDLILTSSRTIDQDPTGFSAMFYDTLFDLSPEVRSIFPDDMTEQRGKLVSELRFLIHAATAYSDPDNLRAFVDRTHQLGERHVGYGVTSAMYEPLGVALIATLRDRIPEFADDHETAWTKLFGLVSQTMLEGAWSHSSS